jgi:hypothetical protein
MPDYIATTQQMSPEAVKARRMGDLLQMQQASGVEPIRSPWQGVGKIAQSMAAGYDSYLTDQAEKSGRDAFSAAVQSGDPLKILSTANVAGVNPETVKAVSAILSPQIHDFGTYSQAVDRYGNPVGPVLPKTINAPEEYGNGVKLNNFVQGGPGGIAPVPVAPAGGSGGPPVFAQNGRLQGNLTGNQGQAPTANVVASPVSPQTQAKIDYSTNLAGQRKAAETTGEADAKYYDSLHKGLTGAANIAAQQKVNIDLLKQIASSPNFMPGAGSDAALQLQRWTSAFGINPNGAAPAEVFRQVAARVLADQFSGLKSAAAQTGETGARIFAPMLAMEEKANIVPQDSLPGIKAKINILDKAGDYAMKWGNMADDYKARNGRLDPGFDKSIRNEIAGARIPSALPQAQSPQGNFSAQDQAALGWARSNPNDPRAAKILQHLGVQ